MPASGIVARNRSTATSIAAVFHDRSGRYRTKSPRRACAPIMRARKRRARNAATRSATAAHGSRCPEQLRAAHCQGPVRGKAVREGEPLRAPAQEVRLRGDEEVLGRPGGVVQVRPAAPAARSSWSTSITGQSPANSSRNAAPHAGVRGQIMRERSARGLGQRHAGQERPQAIAQTGTGEHGERPGPVHGGETLSIRASPVRRTAAQITRRGPRRRGADGVSSLGAARYPLSRRGRARTRRGRRHRAPRGIGQRAGPMVLPARPPGARPRAQGLAATDAEHEPGVEHVEQPHLDGRREGQAARPVPGRRASPRPERLERALPARSHAEPMERLVAEGNPQALPVDGAERGPGRVPDHGVGGIRDALAGLPQPGAELPVATRDEIGAEEPMPLDQRGRRPACSRSPHSADRRTPAG